MPRVPWWMQLARDAAYHVMSRGHNREALFADADDTRYFVGLLDSYRRRFGFRLYHYCLMTNHVHLLLQLDDPRRLSSLMAGLLIAYVRYCNGRHGFVGHRLQGRFKSPAVQREDYWLSCGRHIERNPLVAGLVAVPWDYPWSSCRAYACGEADPLLTEDPCYTELSPEPARRIPFSMRSASLRAWPSLWWPTRIGCPSGITSAMAWAAWCASGRRRGGRPGSA